MADKPTPKVTITLGELKLEARNLHFRLYPTEPAISRRVRLARWHSARTVGRYSGEGRFEMPNQIK
jgi:hypothetical protein